MNLEDNLRDRLEAVQAPPTHLDVEMLVGAGRRRAFRRRTAEAAGGVALVAAVLLAVPLALNAAEGDPAKPPAVGGSGTPAAPTPAPTAATPSGPAAKPSPTGSSPSPSQTVPAGRCAMAELPATGGMDGIVPEAVDPSGRYIAGNDTVGQDFRAVLWTDGRPRALPVVGDSVQATAVNSSGVVVGLVSEDAKNDVFRYQDGVLTRLRTPPGDWHVYPVPAINAAGDIVINAEPRGNTGGEGSIVLLWRAGATTATKLPLPEGANVFEISDDGTLVGALYPDGSATDAYAWDQRGKGRKLARPAGTEGAAAYAISGDRATGGVWADGNGRTVVWDIRTGAVTDLDALEPGDAINAAGWVVNATGQVLRDGADPTLEVPAGQVATARDVSDTGLVVGHAVEDKPDGGESLGPRMWRC
ncbi:hypothetical protein [Phytohabitans houttuyneae]|uniref:Uncharacterized protein n=1 Tax=Phytohabitans houttuyneae TaxID=1076126 RepID=A0A6V8JYF6_9ACTN|nr:hypothetical protein [Phytohabitans houttuyneae]GFJ76294.1 hypothetical protein Phou_004740 [Phytohabitans houttuyneae]